MCKKHACSESRHSCHDHTSSKSRHSCYDHIGSELQHCRLKTQNITPARSTLLLMKARQSQFKYKSFGPAGSTLLLTPSFSNPLRNPIWCFSKPSQNNPKFSRKIFQQATNFWKSSRSSENLDKFPPKNLETLIEYLSRLNTSGWNRGINSFSKHRRNHKVSDWWKIWWFSGVKKSAWIWDTCVAWLAWIAYAHYDGRAIPHTSANPTNH